MPNTHRCKHVVLIAEKALEEKLEADVMRLGAHGYTVTDVRGCGSQGVRAGTWDADQSIRLEVLCDGSTALAITKHVEAAYFQHYAIVAFVGDVGVLRPQKFLNQP